MSLIDLKWLWSLGEITMRANNFKHHSKSGIKAINKRESLKWKPKGNKIHTVIKIKI